MSLEKEARTVNFLKNLKRPVELLALCCLLLAGELTAQSPADGIPAGRGSYQDLVVLFDEFRVLRDDQESRQDFSPSAISDRLEQMAGLQARIADMNVVSWDRPRQVDYLAVRSRLDQYDFTLKRSRPWARDPRG